MLLLLLLLLLLIPLQHLIRLVYTHFSHVELDKWEDFNLVFAKCVRDFLEAYAERASVLIELDNTVFHINRGSYDITFLDAVSRVYILNCVHSIVDDL